MAVWCNLILNRHASSQQGIPITDRADHLFALLPMSRKPSDVNPNQWRQRVAIPLIWENRKYGPLNLTISKSSILNPGTSLLQSSFAPYSVSEREDHI